MDRLIRVLCALAMFASAQFVCAAPRALPSPTWDLDYLTANAPPTRVDLIAKGDTRWFGFLASAGETLSFDLSDSTVSAACGVDLLVVGPIGATVAPSRCIANNGHLNVTLPAAGTYRARLRLRAEQAGTVHLGIRSPQPGVAPRLACAINSLALDSVAGGSWSSACGSVSLSGRFAQYYTFTVPTTQVITINLSSTTNAYLVLHDGPNTNGVNIASDDNSGPGLDAAIVKTLTAGTYTIEATTQASGQIGDFTIVARTNIAPCYSTLKLNKLVSSKWIVECDGTNFDDHYAKFYKLVVPNDEVVTITLSSATNAYLVLRSGSTQLSAVIATDDNTGAGLDAQISQTLTAGTYTIEATTQATSQLGNFTLVARTDVAPCVNPISLDVTTSSAWSTACESIYLADRYAQFYTLTVPTAKIVTISLSSATNSFLVLRDGPSRLGAVIEVNDNSGPGLDARIVRTMQPGIYTIEATTQATSQLGDFALTARTNTAPCFDSLSLNTPTASSWVVSCSAVRFDDHYAKYYTVSIPQTQLVTFNLSSATNAYLVLRGGDNQLGPALAEDDNSGAGLDSRIAIYLQPGLYTLEATTQATGQLGNFSVTAKADTTPCNLGTKLDKVLQGSWTTDCQASSFDDRYAKFYTLTLDTAQIVTTTLSSPTNAYLVLHAGPNEYGPQIAVNDNSGAGLDARIVGWLAAGTYTYEATTQATSQQGNFSIVSRSNSAPCFANISANATVNDSWDTACTSTSFDDHYSKYYTLTVGANRSVILLLTSPTNAYLVVRGGPDGQLGTVVAQDDNSGGGTNARLSLNLTSGTYTIEATTQPTNQLGSFTLTTTSD